MTSLLVQERSFASAQAVVAALSQFAPTLTVADEECAVVVDLQGDHQILAVLNALQAHVRDRNLATRVELDGRIYTVGPD